MVTAIVAAAGQGRRMRQNRNKIFLSLNGKPIFMHSVLTLSACEAVDEIVVVTASAEVVAVKDILQRYFGLKPYRVVAGGSERQYSIANALAVIDDSTDIVAVHDGARPLVETAHITAVIEAARKFQAAGLAVPVKDTIKKINAKGFVKETPQRKCLWAIQTPQAFSASLLKKAYQKAEHDGFLGTDDASLVERLGVKVKLIAGSYRNVKITTPEDMAVAQALLGGGLPLNMRFGMGYDVHKLVEGRKLILGGVEIPYRYGLLGHSDADVLLHAIEDALLGAAGLGDIGRHFPDSDPAYQGISSMTLLQEVEILIRQQGFTVNNIDATIVAEKPKLADYIEQMNRNIALTMKVDDGRVNVKATTTEGLGFAGKREGIAAYAVASLWRA